MKAIWLLLLTAICVCDTTSCQSLTGKPETNDQQIEKTIFVYGNGLDKTLLSI